MGRSGPCRASLRALPGMAARAGAPARALPGPAARRAARRGPGRSGAYVGADPDDLGRSSRTPAAASTSPRGRSGSQAGRRGAVDDLEYGALDLAWEHVCGDFGARYVRTPIRLPVESTDEIVETIWAGVGPRTNVLFISHHTSNTALTLPVGRTLPPRPRARNPNDRRRRARAWPPTARPARARRGLLRGQLSQVAVRTEGRGLPLRPPRASATTCTRS